MAYERKAGNWITSFLKFTSESESPDSYFVWTALSTLAAVVQRKIYNRWVYADIYPNLYITLVGPPGKVHKTSVLRHEQKMLMNIGIKHDVKINVTASSISREAMIDAMVANSFKHGESEIAATTVISSELMSFFKASAETMVEFLTDIYDSPDLFEHTTRGSGQKIIRNAYVNFIAATTPSWIASYFDIAFIDQGFASRTLFIYESKPRFLRARPKIPQELWDLKELLVDDLAHISTLSGHYEFDETAEFWFEEWYEKVWDNERLDYRLQSYHSRKPLMLRKLAILLSIAECDDNIITKEYFIMAEGLLKSIEPSMARTFAAVGKNKYASVLERMFNTILLDEGIDIELLRRQNLQDLGKRDFDENLMNLIAMGAVRMDDENGKKKLYPMVTELS